MNEKRDQMRKHMSDPWWWRRGVRRFVLNLILCESVCVLYRILRSIVKKTSSERKVPVFSIYNEVWGIQTSIYSEVQN